MATTQDENIYNLIPKQHYVPPKPPKYTSKFKGQSREELKAPKRDHRTMGVAKESLKAPEEFVKAHEKEFKFPEKKELKREHIKPQVPPKEEKPLMGLRTNKNFIKQNAVENIVSVPKKPEKKYADTRNGATFPLEPSGLEPIYIHKKSYGETPLYVERRKEEAAKAQEEYDAYVSEHFRRGAMKKLNEEERDAILDGLKANWQAFYKEYQGLSLMIDTAPKKLNKERLELEMKQLERDIELLERHKIIFIANH